MKRKLTFIVVPIAIALTWVFSQAFQTPERGPHGGELKAGNNYFIEMKHSMHMIQAYLLDENEATLSAADLRCAVVLYYADSSRYEVGMSRKGDHGFYGFTPDNYYTSSIVKFMLGGREVSATFDNVKITVDADTADGGAGNASLLQ
jgi:hypothetical protein